MQYISLFVFRHTLPISCIRCSRPSTIQILSYRGSRGSNTNRLFWFQQSWGFKCTRFYWRVDIQEKHNPLGIPKSWIATLCPRHCSKPITRSTIGRACYRLQSRQRTFNSIASSKSSNTTHHRVLEADTMEEVTTDLSLSK